MAIETLNEKQIEFEIRFALGQAQASQFIAAHAKSPEARLRALDALTAIVAARFTKLTVTRSVPDEWGRPLFGGPTEDGNGS